MIRPYRYSGITFAKTGDGSAGSWYTSSPETISGVGLGVANIGRIIVLAVSSRQINYSATPENITINGIETTMLHNYETYASIHYFAASIWFAYVPESTSGDIEITNSNGMQWTNVVSYRLVSASPLAYDTAGHGPLSTANIDIPAGGIVIGAMADASAGPSCIETGLILDYDVLTDTNSDTAATGSYKSVRGETNREVGLSSGITYLAAAFVSFNKQ